MPPIPLEDNYDDVLNKVVRGRKLDKAALAEASGLSPEALSSLLGGTFDAEAARRLAPHLELGADALVALGTGAYRPEVPAPAGLAAFNTSFDDYFVNAYLLWDPETREAVAFDTGSTCEPMLSAVRAHGLTVKLILVTHTHLDHIQALEALKSATSAPAHVSEKEPTTGASPIAAGATFDVGRLHIEARSTTGHSRGGTSYYVTGLEAPVVVVGDALFAGSMGGGIVSYADALANNRREIFTLPDATVVCPGHGPLTTVGLEKRHNPFYPEFQA